MALVDIHVGLSDTRGVADDVLPDIPPPANLFPAGPGSPPSAAPVGAVGAAVAAADPAELGSGDLARVELQVRKILAAAQRRTAKEILLGENAPNGSPVIDSMSAVFVLQTVDKVLGGGIVPRLRGNSTPDDFRSTEALAALLGKFLRRRQATA